jgi:glycosyltransferase involved in cell wall biosynthesis
MGQDAKKENKYPGIIHLKSNELVALSDFLQDEFEKNHRIKPGFVIPPGVDSNLFSSAQPVKDVDILAAGSLIPLKQYSIFIEVVAALKKQIPGIKAVLTGDGPEKSKLQALIAGHDLQSTITLTGELSHPEVLKMMQRAKLFLHTSSYEGFGMVCLEALYAGCEVISFNRVMKQDIEHWHIVKEKEEMHRKAYQLLNNANEVAKTLPFTINQSVDRVMHLFQS